jgi:hypothetical protein
VSDPPSPYAQLFAKTVSIKIDTGKGTQTITGKVVKITPDTVAIKGHGGLTLIDVDKIVGDVIIENRRKKVFRRELRDMGGKVRKHLADRHLDMFVSVLNAIDEGTAKHLHDRIDHMPLGHTHGERNETKVDAKKRIKLTRLLLDISKRSVRQHLNDRHGIFFSVLDGIDEEFARRMHDHISHKDLIHYHKEQDA